MNEKNTKELTKVTAISSPSLTMSEGALATLSVSSEFLKEDYNWKEAFKYAENAGNPISRTLRSFTLEDVQEIVAFSDGQNDGPEWLIIFRAQGAYVYLHAGCDYTGWDCQAGGSAEWNEDLPTLIACIPEGERVRLTKAGPDGR